MYPLRARIHPGNGLPGQPVAAVVVLVVMMAFDFDPLNGMNPGQFQQFLPKVLIFHGFFLRIHPAVPLPVVDPALVKGIDEISAVRIEFHMARVLEGLQPFDGRRQLHPLIGGMGFKAGQFFFDAGVYQNGPPSSRPRIAGAGAVGIKFNHLHPSSTFPYQTP